MSLIKNLIKEPVKKDKPSTDKDDNDDQEKKPPPGKYAKTAIDLQRLKLEKLMKNPDKPVNIPEQRKGKDFMQTVPSFVRNVMGSSAGAGSGEFHVYRHLRRKEYARQKIIQSQSLQEKLDDEYQQKIETNRRIAEEKTAKKRAKRLKRKQNAKKPRQQQQKAENDEASNTESEASDNNDNDEKEAAEEEDEGKETGPPEKRLSADCSPESKECKQDVAEEQKVEGEHDVAEEQNVEGEQNVKGEQKVEGEKVEEEKEVPEDDNPSQTSETSTKTLETEASAKLEDSAESHPTTQ